MARIVLVCAFAALLPGAARGEPISISTHSASGGFARAGDISTVGTSIDLGTLFLPGLGAAGTLIFSDLPGALDYRLTFQVAGLQSLAGFALELLDPLGDGDDNLDAAGMPQYVPRGFSTSNDSDGLSFAQRSGLERSARFAGGAGTVIADEITHRGDILVFAGLAGIDQARVALGLRNVGAARGFLLRVSGIADSTVAPEPASMLLAGSGLVGLGMWRRRRKRTPAAA